jgi:hypothetical protein
MFEQTLPHVQICVGKISGLFPFIFSVDDVRVGNEISAQNIQVKLRLQALNADIYIESGEYCAKESTRRERSSHVVGASVNLATTHQNTQHLTEGAIALDQATANISEDKSDIFQTDAIAAVFDFLKKNSKNLHILRYVNSFKLKRFKFNEQECSIEFKKRELFAQMSGANLRLKFSDQSFCNAEYVLEISGGKYRGNIQVTNDDIKFHAKVAKHNRSYLEGSAAYADLKYENVPQYISCVKAFFFEKTPLKTPYPSQKASDLPSENDCALRCKFTIPRCNVSGTATLGNELQMKIFSGIPLANVESIPIITGVVHRNDDKISIWSFDVMGAFTCQGQYNARQLKIHDLQFKLNSIPIKSKNICVNLSTKIVSSTVVNVGTYKIETSQFSLDDVLPLSTQSEQPAIPAQTRNPALKWKMSKISLHSASNTLHFGNLCIDGFAERGSCTINCALTPDKNVHTPAKPLDIATKCTIKISEKLFSITALQIDSGGNAKVCAELDAESDTFSVLTTALTQLANKEPISATVRDVVRLKGYIKGTFSLSPISVFLNVGDLIAGLVSVDLNISGSLYSPQLNGTFVLKNGLYEHFNHGVVIKNVSLYAKGEGSTLKITHARLDDGTFGGTIPEFDIMNPLKRCAGGYGTFALLTPAHVFAPHMNLNLRCNYLQVAYGKLVKARASGDLKMCGQVTGLTDGPMITGNVLIDEMIVHASTDTNSSDGTSWVVCEKGVLLKKPASPLIKPTNKRERFSMDVSLSGNVIVQADDLRCVLNGSVVAKGPMINPYLVGQLTGNPKLSTKYNLFGKLMNVESGSVVYDDQHINDPYIKIVLVTPINQNSVSATLAGRLSNVKLSLKSNPPLPQEEILSLILFGQGLNQVSADQNCRVKAFSSHLLQGNPLQVFDLIRRRVKLDSIELVDSQNIFNGETTQAVRVGKKFNRMKVFLDQELSSKNNSKMTVRYDVTPELGIDANLSTGKGSSGVGLQWKKKY